MRMENNLRYCINSNSLGCQVFGERAGEGDDGAFGGGVVYHLGGAAECNDGGCVYNADGRALSVSICICMMGYIINNAIGETYDPPFFMCGTANFVIANICMMFDWKVELTTSTNIIITRSSHKSNLPRGIYLKGRYT